MDGLRGAKVERVWLKEGEPSMLKQPSIYSEAQALRSARGSGATLTVLCPTVWGSRSSLGCALCCHTLLAGLLGVGQQGSEQGQSVVVLHQVGALQ
jgi:hypothetical protein